MAIRHDHPAAAYAGSDAQQTLRVAARAGFAAIGRCGTLLRTVLALLSRVRRLHVRPRYELQRIELLDEHMLSDIGLSAEPDQRDVSRQPWPGPEWRNECQRSRLVRFRG